MGKKQRNQQSESYVTTPTMPFSIKHFKKVFAQAFFEKAWR